MRLNGQLYIMVNTYISHKYVYNFPFCSRMKPQWNCPHLVHPLESLHITNVGCMEMVFGKYIIILNVSAISLFFDFLEGAKKHLVFVSSKIFNLQWTFQQDLNPVEIPFICQRKRINWSFIGFLTNYLIFFQKQMTIHLLLTFHEYPRY